MKKEIMDQQMLQDLLEDIRLIKSILQKYENLLYGSKEVISQENLRLRDILTELEKQNVDQLKMKFLDARNGRERQLIRTEINNIFQEGKNRYYQFLQEGMQYA